MDIKKYVKIANLFDKLGYYRQASIIDELMDERQKYNLARSSKSPKLLEELTMDDWLAGVVALNEFAPPELLLKLMRHADRDVRQDARRTLSRINEKKTKEAASSNTAPERLNELAKDIDPHVRVRVANNALTPPDALLDLTYDVDEEVRLNAEILLEKLTRRANSIQPLIKLDIPENVKKIRTQHLYHIRWPHGKEVTKGIGFKSTTELGEEFPFTITLRPRVPGVDPNREDAITSRVSFATTLEGAIGSLGLSNKNGPSYIGIYKPAQAIDVYVPSSGSPSPEDKKFYVHDAGIWGEVWSLRPVTVELQKIVAPYESIKI